MARRPRRRRLGLTRQRFKALVADVLDDLPPWVQERMDNVEVLIEDEPPEEDPTLLGLYEGIPLTDRGADYHGSSPTGSPCSAARSRRRPGTRRT